MNISIVAAALIFAACLLPFVLPYMLARWHWSVPKTAEAKPATARRDVVADRAYRLSTRPVARGW